MNSAEASNSFSPCALPKRLVDRIQISSGMQRIRTNVMGLGKFTGGRRGLSSGRPKTSVNLIILHGASGKQWTEGQSSVLPLGPALASVLTCHLERNDAPALKLNLSS